MWSPQLREYLQDRGRVDSVLAANACVYDRISTEYAQFTRQYPKTAKRMRLAASRILFGTPDPPPDPPHGTLRHLDMGCGPGHVLRWLDGLHLQQFGLDVSLSNLRNAREATGAFVVLGSAEAMPFPDGAFDLVTESSVLHHIENWTAALDEAARVCAPGGGFVGDSEPSEESKDWGWLARRVFNARWYPYKILSLIKRDKYGFRNIRQAQLNFQRAEIHNQPGCGFSLGKVRGVLEAAGLEVQLVCSPNEAFETGSRPRWQEILLHLLSLHNPWNPRRGMFSFIARRPANTHAIASHNAS